MSKGLLSKIKSFVIYSEKEGRKAYKKARPVIKKGLKKAKPVVKKAAKKAAEIAYKKTRKW